MKTLHFGLCSKCSVFIGLETLLAYKSFLTAGPDIQKQKTPLNWNPLEPDFFLGPNGVQFTGVALCYVLALLLISLCTLQKTFAITRKNED